MALRWIGAAIAETGSVADTHPSLSQRLQAIGEQPRFAPPAPGAAAEQLLGAAHERVENYLNSRWQNHVTVDWRRRFDAVRDGRLKLAALAARGEADPLPIAEALERALLEEEFGAGADTALVQLRTLHERAPQDPHA